MPLRTLVLLKQVPDVEQQSFGADGRLRREGCGTQINPCCRRALATAIALAQREGGRCEALSLGPPAARGSLLEALACGVDGATLISDRELAGSDTLATARALAEGVRRLGAFDLILTGRSSTDADTAHVPPQLAELLGLPFLASVRSLELSGRRLTATCEDDDGHTWAEVGLPAVISCAERLCAPARAPAGAVLAGPASVVVCSAADLGRGPWGAGASPTRVEEIRPGSSRRSSVVLGGPLVEQVREAVQMISHLGPFDAPGFVPASGTPVAESTRDSSARMVAVLVERGRAELAAELLGAAARLASRSEAAVVALFDGVAGDAQALGSLGADEVVCVEGSASPEDVARVLAAWCSERDPWALLAPSTTWGREVAARLAARLGAGLLGDVEDVEVDPLGERLVGLKPVLGGGATAVVTVPAGLQVLTARPGALRRPLPRMGAAIPVGSIRVAPAGRVRYLRSERDDAVERLGAARVVVGVGVGVAVEDMHLLDPLLGMLGAELAATRKVTDGGALPRSRQVGITGRSISPALYIAVGLSGRANHMAGLRAAGTILALNSDPGAPVFAAADLGIVADWRSVVPLLCEELAVAGLGSSTAR